MGLVLRYQWESYMDCSEIAGSPDYKLIGEGFTSFPESKNPKKYVRKYYEDKTEQTDVIGYAPSIGYSCDVITDDPVVTRIVEITDQEQIGVETHADIVTVNLWEETDTVGVYVAYKRTYAIIPDGKGEGTGSMIYTGQLMSVGDIVPGTFVRSTRTFIPNSGTETEGPDSPISLEIKSVIPSEVLQNVSPSEGYYGMSLVKVEPILTEEITVTMTESGDIEASEGKYIKKVHVIIPEPETPSTYLLIDEDGTEAVGVVVGEETTFTATASDIREGTIAATEEGVTPGTAVIPTYHTTEGHRKINSGSNFKIPFYDTLDLYDFTKLQIIVCLYSDSIDNSVQAERVVIGETLYDVNSTEPIATVIRDSENKTIDLGITNESENAYVIRYFTYKEIY